MTAQSISSAGNVFGSRDFIRLLRRRPIGTIREWRRRTRSRHELAALSDSDLRDIGYPAEAKAEIQKPFWKA